MNLCVIVNSQIIYDSRFVYCLEQATRNFRQRPYIHLKFDQFLVLKLGVMSSFCILLVFVIHVVEKEKADLGTTPETTLSGS